MIFRIFFGSKFGRHVNDEQSCESGLKALHAYRRQWNDNQGCWGAKPMHNFASHGADAFRMLAVGLNLIVGETEMTDAKAERMRAKALGYGDKCGFDEFHPLYDGTSSPYY